MQFFELISPTGLRTCRGAALPTNTPGIPCIFDPHGRAGICGDWLLGSNLESAALSGMALANHVSANCDVCLFLFFDSKLKKAFI